MSIIHQVRGAQTWGKLPQLLETMSAPSSQIELSEEHWFGDQDTSHFKVLQ